MSEHARIVAAIERRFPNCRVVAAANSRAIIETQSGRQFFVAYRATKKVVRCRLC